MAYSWFVFEMCEHFITNEKWEYPNFVSVFLTQSKRQVGRLISESLYSRQKLDSSDLFNVFRIRIYCLRRVFNSPLSPVSVCRIYNTVYYYRHVASIVSRLTPDVYVRVRKHIVFAAAAYIVLLPESRGSNATRSKIVTVNILYWIQILPNRRSKNQK